MSVALFIVFEAEEPAFDSFVNGKFLATEAEKIDLIAVKLGLRRTDEYISQDLSEYDIALDTLWFSVDEGAKWAKSLFDYIQEHPDEVINSDGVLEDLAEYIHVFNQAKADTKWHLEMDF